MEIPGLTLGPTTTGITATPTLSLVRGDIALLPLGDLLSAVIVPPLQPGNQAQIRVNGTNLTVRLPFPVAPGSALLVRAVPPVVPNGKPALQLIGEVFARPPGATPANPNLPNPVGNPTATLPANLGANATVVETPFGTVANQPPPTTPGVVPNQPVPTTPGTVPRAIPPNFIPATVKQDASGKLELEIGKTLIPIRSDQLQPGQQVLIRLPGPGPRSPFGSTKANATDEVESPDPTQPRTAEASETEVTPQPRAATSDPGVVSRLLDLAQGKPSPTPVSNRPAVVVAEGLQQPTSDGQQTVQIAGREVTLPTKEAIPVGAKAIVQIEATPEGVVVKPLPLNELPPTPVAQAVLNALPSRPDVGPTLQNLLVKLDTLPQIASPEVAQLKSLLANLIPSNSDPPTAAQIQQFVRDGGLQYENRLAKLPDEAPREQVREIASGDLKGQLLRLIRAAPGRETPDAAQAVPPAKQALDAIETQQTINTLAQTNGGTYQLHLPLAGPAQWVTMQLAVQPDSNVGDGEGNSDSTRSSRGFNLLMHVDLTALGETWIDARVSGKTLSAVMYVESVGGRNLARSQSSGLKSALRQAGFESVLVDVRSTTELPEGRGGAAFESLRKTQPINPTIVDERA